MNKLLKAAGVAAIASFAIAGSANAVTFSTANGPYPGTPVGHAVQHDFELGDAPVLSGDYDIVQGSLSNVYQAPLGDPTRYLVVPGDGSSSGTATLNLTSFLTGLYTDSLSFYWGSVDTYNKLEVLSRTGVVMATFDGSDLGSIAFGSGTNPNANVLFTLNFAGSERADFGQLRFTSSQKAFEIDHITLGTSAVPEPATWAMMITGFGLAGAAIRRRRTAFSMA